MAAPSDGAKQDGGEVAAEAEQPKYLTFDDAQKMVNGAVAAERKKVKDELASIAKLRDELAERMPAKSEQPQEEERKTWTSRIKSMEERVAASEKKYQAKHITSEFRRAWTGKGKLDPDFADDHMAALQLRGAIKMDDDERVWVGDVALDDYVSEFAKSDKGKRYKALADSGGAGLSGKVSSGGRPNGNAKPSHEQAKAIVAQAFFGEKKLT